MESAFVAFDCFRSLSREELLLFASRTCLHSTNSRSLAMDMLLSFCLRSMSRAPNITLRLSGHKSEPSLLRISSKNRERYSSARTCRTMAVGCACVVLRIFSFFLLLNATKSACGLQYGFDQCLGNVLKPFMDFTRQSYFPNCLNLL